MGSEPQSSFLTFEEHCDLSRELLSTQRRLLAMGALAADVYGIGNASSIAFNQAADALGRLRYELQIQAARDCPGRRADDLYR